MRWFVFGRCYGIVFRFVAISSNNKPNFLENLHDKVRGVLALQNIGLILLVVCLKQH